MTKEQKQELYDFFNVLLEWNEKVAKDKNSSKCGEHYHRGVCNGLIQFFAKLDDMFNIIEGRHKDSFDELCELLIKEVPNGLM